jgi:hypothetical protein
MAVAETDLFIEDIKVTYNLRETTQLPGSTARKAHETIAVPVEFYHMDTMLTNDLKEQISSFDMPVPTITVFHC